jgi:hypothetical protein
VDSLCTLAYTVLPGDHAGWIEAFGAQRIHTLREFAL